MECTKCQLAKTRIKIVPGRGELTAKILIIGESPSKGDDVLGLTFTGEVGKLVDLLLTRAEINPKDCYFITSILCRPCDTQNGETRDVIADEIFACFDNVISSFSRLFYLKGIIFAGSVAKKWYASRFKGMPQTTIISPALLAHQGGAASSHFLDALNLLIDFRKELGL
jgi:uracil-DNA glycosylase family 4